MSVTIAIPTALRQFAGGQSEVKVEAATAGEALNLLTASHAELRRHLFNDQNALRNFVNVYLNDEDIRHRNGPDTPVKDGDTILIVPSIAGGAVAQVDKLQADSESDQTPQADSLPYSGLPMLSNEEIARYSRHVIIPEVGMAGQRKLKAASVLMIGTGGLGAPLGMYLAAAGVGRLGLVDFDLVDVSNLQRQIIHGTRDVGRPKISSARDRLEDINPHVEIETHETRLTSANALQLFRNYDVIVDGTDNFPTRYLVNDACVLTGIIGAIQASEALKIILGAPDIMVNRLLLFDAWRMRFRELKLRKNPDCPVCGDNPTIKELIDYEEFCGVTPPPPAATENKMEEITATELKQRLDRGDDIQIIDVREPHEYEIALIPGSRLIPLGQVLNSVNEIDPKRETVVHCKMGGRSAKAIETLQRAGFTGHLINLKGGITAWSTEVDPSVPKY